MKSDIHLLGFTTNNYFPLITVKPRNLSSFSDLITGNLYKDEDLNYHLVESQKTSHFARELFVLVKGHMTLSGRMQCSKSGTILKSPS